MNFNIFLNMQTMSSVDVFAVNELYKISHLKKLAEKNIELIDEEFEWSILMYLVCYNTRKNPHILKSIKYWLEKVEILEKLDSIVNYQEPFGRETALSIAVSYKNIETVKILLDSGAKINVQNWSGYTPLHEAVRNKDIDMIKLLLKYKASTTITDNRKQTALDICEDTKIKHLLLEDQIEI